MSSPAAIEGQLLHRAVETGCLDDLDNDQAALVREAQAYLASLEVDLGLTPPGDMPSDDETATPYRERGTWLHELRLEIVLPIGEGRGRSHKKHTRLWGWADAVYIQGGVAVVVDFKFGYELPSQKAMTPQLVLLGLMVLFSYPEVHTVHCRGYAVRHREPYFFRVVRDGEGEENESEQYNVLVKEICKIIRASRRHNSKRIPGEHCLYCKALGYCGPAHTGSTKELQQIKPNTPAPLWLRRWAQHRGWIKRRTEAADEAMRQAAEAGIEIPGYDIVERAGSRSVTNPQQAFHELKPICGEGPLLDCCSMRVTDLEKRFKTPQEFEEHAGHLIARGPATKRYAKSKGK